ncbi:MAG: choice-of-anchor tandem repeat GloVer-containing protein, partial [Opitutaceae bacterium]
MNTPATTGSISGRGLFTLRLLVAFFTLVVWTVAVRATTAAAPTFSPVAGTYSNAQSVTITSTTSGASIRYTTDGSTPTETVGTLYGSPVSISATTTLKAIAYKTGDTDSTVTTGVYTLTAAAPTFSPVAGTYTSGQSTTIKSTTTGASIRYTTDGSAPSSTTGTLYGSPVSIGVTTTLKAIAYKTGYNNSTITSGTYTINPPPAITSQPQATTFSVLYSFTNGYDGGNPEAGLIQGTDGRLYGTASAAGGGSAGTVFAIHSDGSAFTTLHCFDSASDGSNPQSPLIQGSDGRFYGMVSQNGPKGNGSVFALAPDGTGFAVLHGFAGGAADGANPSTCGLVQGSDGNLYGTANGAGAANRGVLFVENPSGTGGANGDGFTLLCSFNGNNGASPEAGLIRGPSGVYYGTTSQGIGNAGTLFKVVTNGTVAGTTLTTMYSFSGGSDGGYILAGLIEGTDGRLYGTAASDGQYGPGTVYAFNPSNSTFSTIYNFMGGDNGGNPNAGLVQGTDGRLYGTVSGGGANNDGAVFVLNADGTGYTALYSFEGSDGDDPQSSLIQGSDGRFYGTASQGGQNNNGTLFAVSPLSNQSTVVAGSTVTFTVAATGTGTLNYQWKLNNATLSGATNPALVLTNVNASNAGSYTVVVSNSSGSVTSAAATLTVTVPLAPSAPVFSPPAGTYATAQTVCIASTGATSIYYTTDGSIPTTTSALYANTGPIAVSANMTLRAIGVNVGGSSPVSTASYVIGLPTITSQPQATTFSVLYSFTNGYDGGNPEAGLIQGTDGRLYGTTQAGGTGNGTVFAAVPNGTGLTTIYSFHGSDGTNIQAGVIQGNDGRLYGTAPNGGAKGMGAVFAVKPDGTG